MEIVEAMRECDDRRLKTKYNNAVFVIQRALALYSVEELAFSFNGGKDSTVLLHLLRAGYFLHKSGKESCRGGPTGNELKFPIRTIYFESPSAFPEINFFTYELARTYNLLLNIIRQDFKSGLEGLLKANPVRAIFLGVRIGDPTAVGQEQFTPSSPGWPPFMRVNPILDWSYRDVWAFLLKCEVVYCSLYDQGYTSIGSIYDTVPNSLLCVTNPLAGKDEYRPAYLLSDGRLERAGRVKKLAHRGNVSSSNGMACVEVHRRCIPTASIIAVGDQILSGTSEDAIGSALCKKLHSVGWSVTQLDVVRNDIDSAAEAVDLQRSGNDMVFIYGGVGPLHSDVTLAGVAKASGVRLMAQLPEGITELLHHENLMVPLMKCGNVLILTATNLSELDKEWNSLLEISASGGVLTLAKPFVSKSLTTTLSDVEAAQPLSSLGMEFPDLYIGCHRKSRTGPLIITVEGKDQARVQSAVEALTKKFQAVACSDI
ncbi:FAD synthase-like protein [Drosera capensis]